MKYAALSLALALIAAPALADPAQNSPAVCPQVSEQFSELLASAKQRVGSEGAVKLEFEVNAQGRAELVALDGSRNYRSAVRSALPALECKPGTPQRYVLNIRFADPAPALPAASTAVAQASAR